MEAPAQNAMVIDGVQPHNPAPAPATDDSIATSAAAGASAAYPPTLGESLDPGPAAIGVHASSVAGVLHLPCSTVLDVVTPNPAVTHEIQPPVPQATHDIDMPECAAAETHDAEKIEPVSHEMDSAERPEPVSHEIDGVEKLEPVSQEMDVVETHDAIPAAPVIGFAEPAATENPPPQTPHAEAQEHEGEHGAEEERAVVNESLQSPSESSMQLYVDSHGDDTDSAIGDFSVMSSTASLRSSMYDYVEENGRRYHRYKEGEYHLPNDEDEQDRLDLQHHLWRLTFDNKLHLAPIETLKGGLHNVLDMATGTGIWAIEFANQFPSASVLGTDLSPIQPEFVPPNCRFEVDDVEDSWLYSYKFDYIHGRALALCFRSHKTVFEHAFNALRPGGILELHDVALPMVALDDSVAGTAFELYMIRLLEGGRKFGKDFLRVGKYKAILEEIGFVDVVEKHFQWPVGTWAKGAKMKTLGAWMREDTLAGISGVGMSMFVKGLGMSVEEVELFLVDVRKEVKSNKLHAYFPIVVVYGRKPE